MASAALWGLFGIFILGSIGAEAEDTAPAFGVASARSPSPPVDVAIKLTPPPAQQIAVKVRSFDLVGLDASAFGDHDSSPRN